jgi:hypothetical protein
MNTELIKRNIHQLIDQIQDEELLANYLTLLKKNIPWESADFFKSNVDDMMVRAKKSLQSIREGRTRKIEDFKADFDKWKQDRILQ